MIVVLADDFSGAAEIAGLAHRYGLRSLVQTAFAATDADCLVIDTASRSLSPREAAERLATLARQVAASRPSWIYKKTDSVLRGPVAAELTAIAHACEFSGSLLVNANPSHGRCVHDGRIFVNNTPLHETAFAHDPEYPTASSDVFDILKANSLTIVNAHDAFCGAEILVGNATQSADLMSYAERIPSSMLAAGGAEFFAALLERRIGTSRAKPHVSMPWRPQTVIVCGSAIGWDHRRTMCQRAGIPIVEVITEAGTLKDIRNTVRELDARFANHSAVMLALGPQRCEGRLAQEGPQALAEAVNVLLSRRRVDHLWIEGGATASAIVRRNDWETLSVTNTYSDGVVELQPQCAQPLKLVVKPGSYPWPAGVFESTAPMPATPTRL